MRKTNHTTRSCQPYSKELIKFIVLPLLFLLFAFIDLGIAQSFQISPVPDWVNIPDTIIESQVDPYEVQSGHYYSNFDVAYNYQNKTEFYRTKSKILNRSGVDNLSQIYIPFDSSFQEVNIHLVKIYRDGEVLNITQEINFSLLNQEGELANNVVSGIIAVHAILEDIRKDDELEVAYSIKGQNPIFGKSMSSIYYLQDVNQIDHLTFRLVTPTDLDYAKNILDETSLSINEYSKNGMKILDIVASHIPPGLMEETMSASSMPLNFIDISTFLDWDDMETWSSSLFRTEPSEELDKVFESLVKPERSLEENATSILEYVQNNIRYTSLNGGIGSMVASLPSEVLKRRFGDCKDKSLLLVHLLKKLGIERSYPALVNSFMGKHLDKYLPGFTVFDHVVVKCEIEGKTLWLDPTQQLQGGSILQRQSYDFGKAFVVNQNGRILEDMNIIDSYSATKMKESFDFRDRTGDGTLEVETVFTGSTANMVRNLYEQYSPKDLAQMYKEVYSTIFLDVQTNKKIKIKDDYENNILVINESYLIGTPWKPVSNSMASGVSFTYEPLNIYNYIFAISCDDKRYPIDIERNNRFYQETTFILPEDAVYQLDNFHTKNEAYEFTKEQKIVSLSESRIVYDFKMLSDQILPDAFKKICIDINDNHRRLPLVVVHLD